MNIRTPLKTLAYGFIFGFALQANAAELVKTCQEFKKVYLEACQIVGDSAVTEKMKFLQDHLNFGGSIIFYEIITVAIDECIAALKTKSDNIKTNSSINALVTFKNQINSDEMYDLNAGVVLKRETLRSGKTRLKKLPYNANRCYSIGIEQQVSEQEEE